MPRRIAVYITCDVCDAPTDDKPDTVALNKKQTEVDLCEGCRSHLRDTLEPYLTAGRKAARRAREPQDEENSTTLICGFRGCEFQGKSKGGLNLHRSRKQHRRVA